MGRLMRFYEGDYAYEIERVFDPATQVCRCWRYNVYRLRPAEQLLRSGEVVSREAAERAGKKALAELAKSERRPTSARKKRAA